MTGRSSPESRQAAGPGCHCRPWRWMSTGSRNTPSESAMRGRTSRSHCRHDRGGRVVLASRSTSRRRSCRVPPILGRSASWWTNCASIRLQAASRSSRFRHCFAATVRGRAVRPLVRADRLHRGSRRAGRAGTGDRTGRSPDARVGSVRRLDRTCALGRVLDRSGPRRSGGDHPARRDSPADRRESAASGRGGRGSRAPATAAAQHGPVRRRLLGGRPVSDAAGPSPSRHADWRRCLPGAPLRMGQGRTLVLHVGGARRLRVPVRDRPVPVRDAVCRVRARHDRLHGGAAHRRRGGARRRRRAPLSGRRPAHRRPAGRSLRRGRLSARPARPARADDGEPHECVRAVAVRRRDGDRAGGLRATTTCWRARLASRSSPPRRCCPIRARSRFSSSCSGSPGWPAGPPRTKTPGNWRFRSSPRRSSPHPRRLRSTTRISARRMRRCTRASRGRWPRRLPPRTREGDR